MINIYIVEDDAVFLKTLKEVVEKSIFINNYDAQINFTPTNIHKLSERNQNNETNVFLLNIKLGEDINGVAMGNEMLKQNKNSYIIYLMELSNCLYEAITSFTRPSNYFFKSSIEDIGITINSSLERVFQELAKNIQSSTIAIKTSNKTFILKFDEIMYFATSENNKDKITVFTDKAFYTFKSTKKALLVKLSNKFIKVNSSTILNLDFIYYIDYKNSCIILRSGYKTYFSRKYRENIKNTTGSD